MKIHELYLYPIKSIRGFPVSSTTLAPTGFPYDRQFMLLRDMGDDKNKKGERYINMHVSHYPEMCLFTTGITYLEAGDPTSGCVTVTHTNPETNEQDKISIPLHPDLSTLDSFEVNLHQSHVSALQMPDQYNSWFSKHFGYEVILVWLQPGGPMRPVLGNLAPNAAIRNPIRKQQAEQATKDSNAENRSGGGISSWLSNFANSLPGLPTVSTSSTDPNNTDLDTETNEKYDEDYSITLQDCAPYLVASTASVNAVTAIMRRRADGNLDRDYTMDVTKFRPNIVVTSDTDEQLQAWEEDFWAELSFAPSKADTPGTEVKIALTANCVRCSSINVDYSTGKFGAEGKGQVFKSLQKERRVDSGHKYSPVFGRYGFLDRGGNGAVGESVLSVGDEVSVTKKNEERTVFRWPGIGQTDKEELYAL